MYMKADTKQTDDKGRFVPGNTIAKDKGVDFGNKPENRHNGAWKKEDTPRYKLEQMMKLSKSELQEIVDDETRPLFEQRLAEAIRDGNWNVIREMIDQVYGKAKESVDVTTQGESINPYAALTTEELRKLAGK